MLRKIIWVSGTAYHRIIEGYTSRPNAQLGALDEATIMFESASVRNTTIKTPGIEYKSRLCYSLCKIAFHAHGQPQMKDVALSMIFENVGLDMNSILVSVGVLLLAIFIDVVVVRYNMNFTIGTLILLSAYWSPSGLAILIDPRMWVMVFGGVLPWLALIVALLGGATLLSADNGDARGGAALFAVLPLMIGGVTGLIAFITGMYRPLPSTIAESFWAGLNVHNPIHLIRVWFP